MSAKKAAKKKPLSKQESNKLYLERKKAKAIAEAFESALDPVPEAEVIQDHVNIPAETLHEEGDFNEFAPNQGMGNDFIDHETGKLLDVSFDVEKFRSYLMVDDDVPLPVQTPEIVVPVVTPVVIPQPIVQAEPLTDAVIVERLINGINYLYPFARLTKGIRGPDIHKIEIIKKNILIARELIKRL